MENELFLGCATSYINRINNCLLFISAMFAIFIDSSDENLFSLQANEIGGLIELLKFAFT